jgi:diketogulonate reductase-like aldo/keto reductase
VEFIIFKKIIIESINIMKIADISGTCTLYNGVKMPYLGLGVYACRDGEEVINAVTWALDAGYRHIDTAALYGNERGVGEAVNNHGIPREEVFVVSKVWNDDQGYNKTLRAFEVSMDRLKLDYLDLYLIHWPVKGKFVNTWKALEYLYKEGKVKAIGISNFLVRHIETILRESEIIPMVNQMEFHPYLIQQSLIDYCVSMGIQYEGWSPLMRGKVFDIDLFRQLSEKYGKSAAQIVIRWNLQKGVAAIPKSSRKDRIIHNAQIFDFEISDDDMALIDGLDRNCAVIGPHPDSFDF